jgi:hypothetical protein
MYLFITSYIFPQVFMKSGHQNGTKAYMVLDIYAESAKSEFRNIRPGNDAL